MSEPLSTLSPSELSRYSRHILLDEIGVAGQTQLATARVLIVGAGGLGSPAALYLAAAGIGTLGITDFDDVEEHNLQRQLLHDTSTIGVAKVTSATQRLQALNPHVRIVGHSEGITAANASSIFRGYDVIVDGTDNFTARYLNNDAAYFEKKPLVFGSVFKFEGQVTVFDSSSGGPCYRCLFPEPPPVGSVPGCGEAGVLGALCGVIGSLQALEAIKLILKLGESLNGRLLTYDALSQTFRTLTLRRSPTCPLCGDTPSVQHVASVSAIANRANLPSTEEGTSPAELSVAAAHALLQRAPECTTLVDVRELWETDICRVPGARFIPMREIPHQLSTLPKDQHLLILCHHGARSQNVAVFLKSRGFPMVSNVAGGIAAWADEIDPAMARY